jgi:putative ABC transport system ATP-binding protein
MIDAPQGNLIEAGSVSHFFGAEGARTQVLFDVSITVPPGQLVIMTGPSGSGKTTLLTLLGALRAGQSGQLQVLDRNVMGLDDAGLTEMRRNIGFIFQMHNLIDSLSSINNVMMSTHLTEIPPADARRNARALLERLGLGHRADYKPGALSGGQRQRVAVARALVNRPRLILADEPTAALDGKSSGEVVDLLRESAAQDGASILMVTHDNRILDKADRIVSMVDGRITSDVMVREQVLICEMLRKIDFFSALGTAEISQVGEQMRPVPFKDGEVLIRQGDIGDRFLLIRKGEIDVHVADGAGDKIVATLGVGRYIGEKALLTDEVRNASAVGRGAGLVYELGKDEFRSALRSAPTFKEQLQKGYFGR